MPGLGLRHIISQAFTGDTTLACTLTHEEIIIHLDIIDQCLHNSRSSNTTFARIIRNIVIGLLSNPCRPTINPQEYHMGVLNTLICNPNINFSRDQFQAISSAVRDETNKQIIKCQNSYDIFRVTRLPTKYSEIRKYYLEGKDAIIPNLPFPRARLLSDGVHAYVSPLEIISHYLAFGYGNQTCLPPAGMDHNGVEFYHHSIHAKTISKHVQSTIAVNQHIPSFPLILFLTDWQDEFDKNNIIRNKSQIFLRTLTVLLRGKRGILEKHTFIVGLGSKGDSRYTLDKVYNQDLSRLSRVHEAYDGRNQKNLGVMAILVASLEDRIERSGMLFIGQQNQNFCASFGHSTFLRSTSKLPACEECFHARLELLSIDRNKECYAQGIQPCLACADWYILCDNGSLDVRIDSLPLYPKETHPGFPEPPIERRVGPNVHMLCPMRLGFPQMKQGADFAFFNYHCSKKQGGRTLKWTVAKLEFYVKSLGLNLAFYQMIRQCAEKYVDLESALALEKFREEVYPPSWERPHLGLAAHLEATFHCVFRGLIPDHVEISLAALKTVTPMFTVRRVLNRILSTVKAMYLPRLTVSVFGKAKDNPTSMVGWQGSQENAFSKLMVHTLIHCRIHALPKPNVSEDVVSKTFDLLEKATYAFFCTISRIMSLVVMDWLPDETLQYAKLYLSYLSQLEELSLGAGKSPMWKRTGNHVGLLNIPEVMRRYGPVHTFYEAADETTIQWMKPLVKNVSTSSHSWKVTVLDNVTCRQTLSIVSDDFRNIHLQEDPVDEGWDPFDFRISSDLGELTRKYKAGEALSGFFMSGCYLLLPFWGIDELSGKRVIQFMQTQEYEEDTVIIGCIRYECFDETLVTPPLNRNLPTTRQGVHDCATSTFILLTLIPETGSCNVDGRLLIHVCGLTWDVVDPASHLLVKPQWNV
jgi:hypothetical protein